MLSVGSDVCLRILVLSCALASASTRSAGAVNHDESKRALSSVVIKLPLEDCGLGWQFDPRVLGSVEVTLSVTRSGEPMLSNTVANSGSLCKGWDLQDRGLAGVDGVTSCLVGSLPHLLQNKDELSLHVVTRTNMWGQSTKIEGYLPPGAYDSTLKFHIPPISGQGSVTQRVELTQWNLTWPLVITKFNYSPDLSNEGPLMRLLVRRKMLLEGKREYALLLDPDRMQTRLYRFSPSYAGLLGLTPDSGASRAKTYLERQGMKFPEGSYVRDGFEPLTFLVRNKQGFLNGVPALYGEDDKTRIFGLYGDFLATPGAR